MLKDEFVGLSLLTLGSSGIQTFACIIPFGLGSFSLDHDREWALYSPPAPGTKRVTLYFRSVQFVIDR